MDPNLILNKILRLARLDTTVFDEVRDDANELIPAMIVAGVSALLAGLGATLFYEFNFDYGPEKPWLNTFILGGVFMAALYLVWVLIAYVIIVRSIRPRPTCSRCCGRWATRRCRWRFRC